MVALFGGSFDPVHIGHLRIAEDIREYYSLEKVIFIPSYLSPLKTSHHAPVLDRLNMLKMAIKDNENFDISTYEVEREGKSYTIDTVSFFREILGYNPVFIVGTDAFLALERWKEPKRLLGSTNFIIVSRQKKGLDKVKKLIFKIDKNVEVSLDNKINPIECKVYFYDQRQLDISSTEIRERTKKGLSIKYLTLPQIEKYIKEKNLYR